MGTIHPQSVRLQCLFGLRVCRICQKSRRAGGQRKQVCTDQQFNNYCQTAAVLFPMLSGFRTASVMTMYSSAV